MRSYFSIHFRENDEAKIRAYHRKDENNDYFTLKIDHEGGDVTIFIPGNRTEILQDLRKTCTDLLLGECEKY